MKTLDEVVLDVVNDFVSKAEPFTALDVSNKVKETFPLARHREVRDLVRDLFVNDLANRGYARTPINVTLNDGSTVTAMLYHDLSDSWDLEAKYDAQKRSQNAVKPGVVSVPTVSTPATMAPNGTITVTTLPSSTPVQATTVTVVPVKAAPVKPMPARDVWDQLFKTQPSLFPRR
jgi:hypothetical protein